jgi:hypothetical protein
MSKTVDVVIMKNLMDSSSMANTFFLMAAAKIRARAKEPGAHSLRASTLP